MAINKFTALIMETKETNMLLRALCKHLGVDVRPLEEFNGQPDFMKTTAMEIANVALDKILKSDKKPLEQKYNIYDYIDPLYVQGASYCGRYIDVRYIGNLVCKHITELAPTDAKVNVFIEDDEIPHMISIKAYTQTEISE